MKRGSLSTRVALAETSIPEGPRRELRAGVTGIDLELGGVAIRAGDLPLLRRVDGGLRQCVRLAVTAGDGPRPRSLLAFAAGESVLDEATAELGGATTVRLFVPAVERPTKVTLESELEGGPGRRDELELLPQRRWRVHLVHHSHFDLGYTDPQALVLRHHLAYLDSALDLAAADDGFRWTIESNLPLERWLAARPRADARRAARPRPQRPVRGLRAPVHHARRGGVDRRARAAASLRGGAPAPPRARDRRRDADRRARAAPPGLPLVLAGGGVRYLAVAHNWASRATPYLTGGESLPRAFHWSTASGKRVLVWHTDSPHGIAYLEGNLLGLADSYADAHDLLPEYLAALALRGHPYAGPHETLGLPGRRPRRRIRSTCSICASRACSPTTPGRVRARPRSPPPGRASTPTRSSSRRRTARSSSGSKSGTAPSSRRSAATGRDWWADGLGSAAREVGFNRRAQAAVRTAQTLHVMADALTGADPELDWAGEADRVYERMALFDEHTWCAAHPAGRALDRSRVLRAAVAVARLRSPSRHGIAPRRCTRRPAPASGRRASSTSILVLNPSGRARTDLVELFVPAGRVDSRRPSCGRRRGARRAGAARARRAGAESEPAAGQAALVRRPRRAGARLPPLRARRGRRGAARGRAGASSRTSTTASSSTHEGGYALRLVDLELGHDLVDGASAFGFGQVVRDLYGGPLHATARARPGAELTYAPPDGARSGALILSRTTPADGIVRERVSSPVEERVTLRTRADRPRGGRDDLPPRARRAEARRHRAAREAARPPRRRASTSSSRLLRATRPSPTS